MNREILFRGKRVDNGAWVIGSLRYNKDDDIHIIYDMDGFPFEVIPETVGQYTGLKDKNGARIFEGDIIKAHGYHRDVGEWVRNFEVVYDDAPGFGLRGTDGELYAFFKKIFIIGTIHDNQELLK